MGHLPATVILLLGATPAAADSIWDHNGSTVTLSASGPARRIAYRAPHPALAGAGIGPGTVLFEGRRQGDAVAGTAYTFRAGCPPAPYQVRGVVREAGRLTLRGPAPVWAGRSCDLAGLNPNSPHAALDFSYLGRVGEPAPGPAPRRGGGEKSSPTDF